MIEDVKQEIQDLIEGHFEDILDTHSSDHSVSIDLEAPKQFFWDFDANFTIVNQYPTCLILSTQTSFSDRMSSALRVVEDNRLAVVFLLVNQDATKLDRIKSRYAESFVKLLKQFNTGSYSRNYITSFHNISVAYDRPTRDENTSVYLSSVWIFFEARQDETL